MPWSNRRAAVVGAGVVLTLALIAAHYAYWYAPRERPADFGETELSAALERDARLDVALWIPFPHQNLAQLTDSSGDRRKFLGALFRTLGSPPPTLPRFGPLSLPPAREMVVAVDAEDDRLLVVCRLYPGLAIVARLAGIVAGNPWLRGGEVEIGGERALVSWRGLRWTVASAGMSLDGTTDGKRLTAAVATATATGSAGELPPALAAIKARRPPVPLPPGVYRLARRGAGLEIRLGGSSGVPQLAASLDRSEQFGLLWLERPPDGPRGSIRALGVLPTESHTGLGLPEIVTMTRGLADGWEIAGLGILRTLTGGGRSRRHGAWSLAASSEAGLDSAATTLDELEPALADPMAADLTAAGALDLEAQRLYLDTAIEIASKVPLVPVRYRQALEDLRILTRPLEHFDLATLWVRNEPAALVLRLRPAVLAD